MLTGNELRTFDVQQAEEIIHNIFASFKSKLLELKWTDQEARQFVETKVR